MAKRKTPTPAQIRRHEANNIARAFSRLCDARGIDLPLELCLKLVELFDIALSKPRPEGA